MAWARRTEVKSYGTSAEKLFEEQEPDVCHQLTSPPQSTRSPRSKSIIRCNSIIRLASTVQRQLLPRPIELHSCISSIDMIVDAVGHLNKASLHGKSCCTSPAATPTATVEDRGGVLQPVVRDVLE